MDMIVSSNVLIIDDKYEEVMPIIKAFAKRGISSIYWDGELENKPEKPLSGIRLVFLDMRFSSASDEHSISRFLFTLLQTSIDSNNGPYILCIWSKHNNEYLESFKKDIMEEKRVPQPYLIIDMEKSKFLETVSESNDIYNEIAAALDNKDETREEILEILERNNFEQNLEKTQIKDNGVDNFINKLNNELKKVNALSILLIWENMVNKSANNMVNSVAAFSDISESWNENIEMLIQSLAKANAGKSLGDTSEEYIVNAMISLNQMLPDELWNQLAQQDIEDGIFHLVDDISIKKNIDDREYSISLSKRKKFIVKEDGMDFETFRCLNEIKDDKKRDFCTQMYREYLKIVGNGNFKLICESKVPSKVRKPGGIYKAEDENLLNDLKASIFKEGSDIACNQLVKLDISSSCDYAQDKLKRIRILPGLIVDIDDFSLISCSEDIYCTPELRFNDRIFKMAFNFHFIMNDSKKILESEKLFSFREVFLNEIKHHIATHISRIGIINL